MKDRKYLKCVITRNDGSTFTNPLLLSEAHFITKMAKENEKVLVTCETAHEDEFKSIFGL